MIQMLELGSPYVFRSRVERALRCPKSAKLIVCIHQGAHMSWVVGNDNLVGVVQSRLNNLDSTRLAVNVFFA